MRTSIGKTLLQISLRPYVYVVSRIFPSKLTAIFSRLSFRVVYEPPAGCHMVFTTYREDIIMLLKKKKNVKRIPF